MIMEVIMKKILIYGAGGGGESLFNEIKELNEPYEILAFVDRRTGGTEKLGLPVIFPKDIQNFDYDFIFVATQDNTVPNTLVEEFGISRDKINHERFFKSAEVSVRVRALERFSEMCDTYNLMGTVAEVGVYQGDFAKHINRLFKNSKLYLYDTFEGFSEKDLAQEHLPGGGGGVKSEVSTYTHYANTAPKMVLEKMQYPERVIVRRGIFPDTLTEEDKNEKYVFVSLDPDLYAPVLAGLEYFYPRLVPGGEIFVHDYFSKEDPGVKRAVSEFIASNHICASPLGDFRTLVVAKPF